jgi:Txe/YoeB family toxin of toxin-antitoxin system
VKWELYFSRHARKDAEKLKRVNLKDKTDSLLDLLEQDPFRTPPPFEKLVGELVGFYSRRITIQHRLVYRIDRQARRVFVERMWTHYE